MKYTKAHEAARAEMHMILAQFYRGRMTMMEMNKAIFKAVAHHRYNDAWVEIAAIAMTARSTTDFENKVVNSYAEIVYA